VRPRPSALDAATPLVAAAVLLAGAVPADPPDALGAAAAAALLIALGSFGLRVAGKLLGSPGPATLVAAAGALGSAGAIVPATLLGLAGHLRPGPFLVAVAGLAALAAWLPRVRLGRDPARPGDGAAAETAGARPSPPHLLRRAETALLVAALAAIALHVAATAARERWEPPRKLDDPSYHLSTVALWTHTHDLRRIKLPYGDPSTAFYPIGGELTAWALVAPLGDGDWIARWNQLLFGLLSVAAAVAVARRLGVSRRGALVVAVLWASVPRAFPALLFTAGNDHSTAFYLLVLVDAVLLAAVRPSLGTAAFTGVAAGLLVGTKYLGVLLAAPVALLAAALVALGPRVRWRRRLAFLGAAAAIAVAVGGYTYLRNATSTGNPLFPAPIALAGLELPGWEVVTLEVRRRLPQWALDPVRFLLRRDLFGQAFVLVTLPAALLAPFLAAGAPGSAFDRLARAGTFALPWAFYALFVLVVHDHRENRYLFAGIALAAVAAGWILDLLAARGRRAAAAASLVGAGVGLVVLRDVFLRYDGPTWQMLAAALFVLGLSWLATAPLAWHLTERGPVSALGRSLSLPLAAAMGIAAAAALGDHELDLYRDRQLRDEPIADWLDRRTRAHGSVVAYLGFNSPYPFAGARLQNRIELVPRNWNLEGRHFRWGDSPEIPAGRGRYARWRTNLEALGVEWVVVDLRGRPNPERRWMLERPRRFRRLWHDDHLELWRVATGPA